MKNYRADILIQIMKKCKTDINSAYKIYDTLNKKELNKLALQYEKK